MDIKQARICADLNVFSYYPQTEETVNQVKELGFLEVRFFDKNGAQAFVCHNKTKIFVMYRGTEMSDIQDWSRNFSLWPRRGEKHGKVHSGFAEATDQIWKDISYYLDAVILTHRGMEKNICFGGHSQGGAMAIISAARSKYVVQIYTFGTPKMCNRTFAKNIKSTITRFANNNDLVPRMMPGGLYTSCGTEYRFYQTKIYKIESIGQSTMLWLKAGVLKLIKLQFFTSFFADHNTRLYASAMRYNKPANY